MIALLLAGRLAAGASVAPATAATRTTAAAAALTVVDDLGATVTLASAPVRLVSLSPGATEIFFALGGGTGRLVGTCKYCDFPPAAKSCPRVGDFANPSLEAILAAKPDVVISNGGPQREVVLALRARGVPVIVLKPASVEEVLGNIARMGTLLDRSRYAARRISRIRMDLAAVSAAAPAGPRPTVYFEMWADPLMAVGDASFPGELIRAAGGENIAKGVAGEYPRLSAERVIASNPDVIILSHSDDPAHAADLLAKRPGWARLAAVRNRRVYADLDMNTLMRPGPRLVEGARQIAARLRRSPDRRPAP